MVNPEYFDTPGAADYIACGKSTLDKLRLTGEGPDFIKMGRRVVYKRTDLDEWLAGKRQNSTSETQAA